MAKDTYFYALGRRKRATARVRLQSGKGNITINKKTAAEYFSDSEYLLSELKMPFFSTDEVHATSAQPAIRTIGLHRRVPCWTADFTMGLPRSEKLQRLRQPRNLDISRSDRRCRVREAGCG